MAPAAEGTVYERRRYAVTTAAQARQLAWSHLDGTAARLGLPEVDDRYHVWRVPLVDGDERHRPLGFDSPRWAAGWRLCWL